MLPEETPIQPEQEPEIIFGEPIAPASTPSETRKPFWGYQDLLIVLGLTLAAMIVIGVAALATTKIWPGLSLTSPVLAFSSNIFIYLALLVIFKFVFQVRYDRPMLPSLGWRMPEGRAFLYAALGGLALPFLISGVGYLLKTPKVSTQMDEMMKSMPVWVLAPLAVILAPFFEELFFRGFLQPLLSRTFGLIVGILITSALFGGLHAAEYSFLWQYVVAIGLVGVALGTVRAYTDSIMTSTVMHACFNGLQVVAFVFSKHQK